MILYGPGNLEKLFLTDEFGEDVILILRKAEPPPRTPDCCAYTYAAWANPRDDPDY